MAKKGSNPGSQKGVKIDPWGPIWGVPGGPNVDQITELPANIGILDRYPPGQGDPLALAGGSILDPQMAENPYF